MFGWWTAATLGEPFQSHAAQKWRRSFACAKAHWTVSWLFFLVRFCWYWYADMFCLREDLNNRDCKVANMLCSHMEHISTLLVRWWHGTIKQESLRCWAMNILRSDVCSLRTFQWFQYYHALALEGHLFQSQWACHRGCGKFSRSTCFSGWEVGTLGWIFFVESLYEFVGNILENYSSQQKEKQREILWSAQDGNFAKVFFLPNFSLSMRLVKIHPDFC